MADSKQSRAWVEWRDLLELVLIPGLAVFLPWPLCFRIFTVLARCNWLYRGPALAALAQAQHLGDGPEDESHWLFERRLTTLIDHADHYLACTRSNRWLGRFVDVTGDWGSLKDQAGLLVTFHYGAGLWAIRHAHAAGLEPRMLVAEVAGQPFAGRWVLRKYIESRMRAVSEAQGGPVIYVPGSMGSICEELSQGRQILVVMDVPPDQGHRTQPVEFLGRAVEFPSTLATMAVEGNLPVTLFVMDFDLRTGRRKLLLVPLGEASSVCMLMEQVFAHLDHIVRTKSASWHLWAEAPRFFQHKK
jgi:hypothetical protein